MQFHILKIIVENASANLLAQYTQQADNGSCQHQLALGKYYFHRAENLKCTESGVLAVNYLIKASRQGDAVATQLLQQCVEKNLGMECNLFKFYDEDLICY